MSPLHGPATLKSIHKCSIFGHAVTLLGPDNSATMAFIQRRHKDTGQCHFFPLSLSRGVFAHISSTTPLFTVTKRFRVKGEVFNRLFSARLSPPLSRTLKQSRTHGVPKIPAESNPIQNIKKQKPTSPRKTEEIKNVATSSDSPKQIPQPDGPWHCPLFLLIE